jgi:hypothetical protein
MEGAMQHRILRIVSVLIVLAFLSACQRVNQEHLKNFEVVWQAVNDPFPDPTFGGVDRLVMMQFGATSEARKVP